ncbi:hypothetical protein KSP39_PZI005577 [Platanthera zijinensis]|uniref:Small-subunit processome Utp12 domain-containing protein n=1 Tax=Platanthera zijinensis TaxID=2320716 RepID=A0AAP0BSY2_9ASPA
MADSKAMATHKHKKKSKKRELSNLDCSIREKHVNGEGEMRELEAEPDMNGPTMEEKLASFQLLSDGKEKNTTHKHKKKSKKRDLSNLDCSIRKKHVNGEGEMPKLEAESDLNGPTMEEKQASLELLNDGKEKNTTHKHKKKSKKRELSNLDCSIREKHVNGEGEMQELEAESDMNGPTMEEKLASLQLLNDGKEKNTTEEETPPSKCIPSADSVHVLLKQALHAQDHALLLNCLSMKDEMVITKSTELLNPSEALKLLKSLISMIELRGAILICALPWIKCLLSLHASSIASQESSLQLLNSLYQLIDSRTSTYRYALQLSTCLDCLLTEIPEGDEETAAPVIIYEDGDSDDDEGEEPDVSMESDDENEGLGTVIDSADNSDGTDIMSD